ncbi:PAS domain-containing protein [Aquisediminimonas profunda]|uniref:PAS domain-containing protein n=1 Tax=Aquisediminimonas profunda TaxID=1550733 RepID=UPI001C631A56|nr:hypothetical protein [Aquisediminimonas profunda]
MDQTGQFARDDDDGVETPLNVGTDERRMHVRAYNYWVSLLNGRAYPAIEDLDPANMDDFGPHSVLLDFTGGIESPTIAFLGHALRQECDMGNSLETVSDIPSRSLLSRLTDHYLQIIANRAPIGFEAEFVNGRGNNTMYRGILMPFSSDDDNIDFIYGVINWKEVADEAETKAIIGQVEQVLQTAPVRHDPPVNVWADGPSGAGALAPLVSPGFDAMVSEEPEEIVAEFEPDGSETLWDWLAAARETADAATHSESRSRQFLYRALSLAYDFAAVADHRPDEYAELLADNRIVAQARAPMTPIVKLVFGVGYDKTRLAEYGMALSHGRRLGIGIGGFQAALESHPGGLKGMVYAERAERRPASKAATATSDAARERARAMAPRMIIEAPGDEEFVVLVARRIDQGHVGLLGTLSGDAGLVEKALRALTQ